MHQINKRFGPRLLVKLNPKNLPLLSPRRQHITRRTVEILEARLQRNGDGPPHVVCLDRFRDRPRNFTTVKIDCHGFPLLMMFAP